MTLIRNIVAWGFIFTTATPVAAFDFLNWGASDGWFRAEIADGFPGSVPVVAAGQVAAPVMPVWSTGLAPNPPAATTAVATVPAVRRPAARAVRTTAPSVVMPAAVLLPVSLPAAPMAFLQPAVLPVRTSPVTATVATTAASRPAAATLPASRPAASAPAPQAVAAPFLFDFSDFSFSAILDAVNAAIAARSRAVADAVADAVPDSAGETASSVVDAITDTVSDAADAVVDAIASAVDSVIGTVGRIAPPTELSGEPVVLSLVQAPVDPATGTDTSTAPAPAPASAPEIPVSEPMSVASQPAASPVPVGEYIAPQGSGTVYYVDFANGNDANSGTSADRPWKRAPGDTLATGTPASVVLRGGDTVRFKGGVSYRGSLRVKFSGTAQEPIVFTGTGYGSGSAIFDGADPVTSSVPCPSQLACGGAANWSSLRLVRYVEPSGTTYRKLFDEAGALFEARSPAPADSFWGDGIEEMAVIPRDQANALLAGRLDNAQLAAAAAGEPNARLLLWEFGNVVKERRILSISGSTILFDATGVRPYTDRDSRGAIVGSAKAVTRAGLYAVIAPGTAIVFPRRNGGTNLFIGSGRFAFNMNGQSNIVIGGFAFLRGTADSTEWSAGVAVNNLSSTVVRNLVIERNRFAHASLRTGRGVIHLGKADGVSIRDNSLSDLEFASGMRLFGSNFSVERNRLQRIGRTGIYMGGVVNGVVRSNIIADLLGHHGNALSFYLANQNIQVMNNCVFGATRPLTWHGNGDAPVVNNLQFTGNILISTPDGDNASASWGKFTDGVTYRNNLAIGGRYGVLLNARDSNVTFTQNRSGRIVFNGGQPAAWTVSNNQTDATYAEVANATLTMDGCRARGHSGDLVVSL